MTINPILSALTSNTNVSAVSNTAETSFSSALQSKLSVPTSLDDIFEKAAKKYDLPSALLKAVGKAESDYNPKAVSHCGAQGIMQLMPGTARELGVSDAFDPEQNIMGGAKYLSSMLEKYNGNTKLALAAYNAGSNNVDKYGGVPPFKETQNYVVKVMEYAGAPSALANSASKVSVAGSSSGLASNLLGANTGSTLNASALSQQDLRSQLQSLLSNSLSVNSIGSLDSAGSTGIGSGSSDSNNCSLYMLVLLSILNFTGYTDNDYIEYLDEAKSQKTTSDSLYNTTSIQQF